MNVFYEFRGPGPEGLGGTQPVANNLMKSIFRTFLSYYLIT